MEAQAAQEAYLEEVVEGAQVLLTDLEEMEEAATAEGAAGEVVLEGRPPTAVATAAQAERSAPLARAAG